MNSIYQENEIVNTWHKPKQIEAVRANPRTGESLEDVRQEIALRIERHLINGKGMLVINAPAGVGKSHQALDVAEGIADTMPELGNIAWFTPRHNGYKSLERDNTIWLHCTGRRDDKYSKNGSLLEPGNCVNAGTCYALGSKGYSPGSIFCSPEDKEPKHWQCQVPREQCDYWQQWSEPAHRYMPSHYINVGKLWTKYNHLPILDEIDAYSLSPQPVTINAELLTQWLDSYPQYENWIKPLLNLEIKEPLADSALQDILSDILPETDILISAMFLADIGDIELESTEDIEKLPHKAVEAFLREVYQTVEDWRNGKAIITRIVAHPDCSFAFYPQADFEPDFTVSGEKITKLIDFPSVLLNATCEVSALQQIFSKYDYPVSVYQPFVALHPQTTITYDVSRNYAKGSLRAKNDKFGRKSQWINALRQQIAKYQKTLVIATIEGESILKIALQDEIKAGKVYLAHYGNVSGLNQFEDCQQVILSQPFHPSPMACAGRYRSIYGGIEGKPLNLETAYRFEAINNGNKAYRVCVHTMVDERIRPIFEAWRNSEHYQAAHRVRPILSPKHIHIMFAVPIENLPASEIIYRPAKNGRRSALDKMEQSTRDIIQAQGYCTQACLKSVGGFSNKTVSKYWLDLQKKPDFELKPIQVSSERYQTGRTTGALVLCSQV